MNLSTLSEDIKKEFVVNEKGIGSVTLKGLERLTGITRQTWKQGGSIFTQKVDAFLATHGFEGCSIFKDDRVVDTVAALVVKYYAYQGQAVAQQTDAALSVIGLRVFIQQSLGWNTQLALTLAAPQKPLSVTEMKAIVVQEDSRQLNNLEKQINERATWSAYESVTKVLRRTIRRVETLETEVTQLKEAASIHDTPAMAMTRLKHAQQMELLERQHELRRIERAEKAQEVINAREEKKQFETDTKYAKTIEKLMILAEKHQALSARIVNQSGVLKHLKADQVRDIFKLMSEQGLGTLNGEGNRLKFSLNQDNSQN
jgi:hypothetical protein